MLELPKNEPSELVFQRAYARLLTDSSFREVVLSDEPLDDQLQFDPAIIERLRGMDVERVCLFSDLLLTNVLATVQEALPNSAVLLGPRLFEIVGAFSDAALRNDHRKYPEARAFGNYLLDRLEHESLGPPYLHDVLIYELTSLQLRFEYEEPFWYDGMITSETEFTAAMNDVRPVYIFRHSHQAVLSFSYDVERICDEVETSGAAIDAEPEASIMLLHVSPGGALQREIINVSTAAFLDAVNGSNSVNDIVHHVAGIFDQRGKDALISLRAGVQDLCLELLQRGVIAFGCTQIHMNTLSH